jgi:hypothetical protein
LEQIEFASPLHLALDQLELVDLAYREVGLTLQPQRILIKTVTVRKRMEIYSASI